MLSIDHNIRFLIICKANVYKYIHINRDNYYSCNYLQNCVSTFINKILVCGIYYTLTNSCAINHDKLLYAYNIHFMHSILLSSKPTFVQLQLIDIKFIKLQFIFLVHHIHLYILIQFHSIISFHFNTLDSGNNNSKFSTPNR